MKFYIHKGDTYNRILCRLEKTDFVKLMVCLQGKVWRQEIEQLAATWDFVGCRTVSIVVFVATDFLRYASAIVAVQFSVAWRFTWEKMRFS